MSDARGGGAVARPLDPERDLEAYLRVRHQAEPLPRTVAEWRERERLSPRAAFRRHLVGERDGAIVAVAMVHDTEMVAGDGVAARVIVDRQHRRSGAGAAMAAAVERLLAERAPAAVITQVDDDDRASRDWAERRGFRAAFRMIRSRLDLTAFDPAPHRADLDRAEAAGLRVEVPGDRDRLHALYSTLLRDVPEAVEPIARDAFDRQLDEPGVVVLVLADGQSWVAQAAVRPIGDDGAWNAFTGVLPAYRGRGLARAIKVAAAIEAARAGRHWIETSNHDVNAPMLAVNRALGYRPVTTTLFMRRPG